MISEIKEYVNIIKKGKWFIIIITLLTTFGSAVISFHNVTPSYLSVTTMVPVKASSTSNGQIQNSDIQLHKDLMETYSEILQSKSVAIKASKKLNGSISADMIRSFYRVNSGLTSQILTVEAQGTAPQQALDIANAVTESFKEEVQRVYPFATFRIVDEPELPNRPISQDKAKKIFVTFLLALVASVGTIFARGYFDTTIRTRRDVEKYLNLSVIGSISKYSMK